MTAPTAPLLLYVEDDRINILLMQENLAALPGWRLQCVETGRDALTQLDELRPSFALIDMQLPDMTGLELLLALRKLDAGASLPCVALSADNPSERVRAARAAGFLDYWLKPIDMARLADALQRTSQP